MTFNKIYWFEIERENNATMISELSKKVILQSLRSKNYFCLQKLLTNYAKVDLLNGLQNLPQLIVDWIF